MMTRHERNRQQAEKIISRISRNMEIAASVRIGTLIRNSHSNKTSYYAFLRQLRAK